MLVRQPMLIVEWISISKWNGAKVTKKFKPINAKVIDEVPGFFSDDVEQEYTEEYIDKYGYENVRDGVYQFKNIKKVHQRRKQLHVTSVEDKDIMRPSVTRKHGEWFIR